MPTLNPDDYKVADLSLAPLGTDLLRHLLCEVHEGLDDVL